MSYRPLAKYGVDSDARKLDRRGSAIRRQVILEFGDRLSFERIIGIQHSLSIFISHIRRRW